MPGAVVPVHDLVAFPMFVRKGPSGAAPTKLLSAPALVTTGQSAMRPPGVPSHKYSVASDVNVGQSPVPISAGLVHVFVTETGSAPNGVIPVWTKDPNWPPKRGSASTLVAITSIIRTTDRILKDFIMFTSVFKLELKRNKDYWYKKFVIFKNFKKNYFFRLITNISTNPLINTASSIVVRLNSGTLAGAVLKTSWLGLFL